MSNWVINDVLRMIRESDGSAEALELSPEDLAEIVALVEEGVISSTVGKELLERAVGDGSSPRQIVEQEGLAQVSDESELRAIAERVVAANPEQAATYRAGKAGLLGWFVGQVMKESAGKADPKAAGAILQELLQE